MTTKSMVLLGGSHDGEKVKADIKDDLFMFDETIAYEGESIVNEKGEYAKGVGSFVNWAHYKSSGAKKTIDGEEFEVFEFHAKGEGFRDLDGFLREKPGGELIK